jgi:hypothetical protein
MSLNFLFGNGALIYNDTGADVNDLSRACCCPNPCRSNTQCSPELPTTYTATFSGFTGGDTMATINGAYTLTLDTSSLVPGTPCYYFFRDSGAGLEVNLLDDPNNSWNCGIGFDNHGTSCGVNFCPDSSCSATSDTSIRCDPTLALWSHTNSCLDTTCCDPADTDCTENSCSNLGTLVVS